MEIVPTDAEILKVYSDIHCEAEHELMTLDELLTDYLMDEPGVIKAYLGDNVDRTRAKKKRLPACDRAIDIIRRADGPYRVRVWGNHELLGAEGPLSIAIEVNGKRIILDHSDRWFWGHGRALEYRHKKPGSGWFMRNIWSRGIEELREVFPGVPDQEFIDAVVDYSKYWQAQMFIGGHKHPREMFDEEHDGVRVIVVKRGVTVLNLKEWSCFK